MQSESLTHDSRWNRNGTCPMDPARWSAVKVALRLTDRELEIVQALFDGQKEEDIARTLSISRYTVHTHLGRLYRKLQVDCCTGLLLRVFRECLTLEQMNAV
jgi:DNA-binding NarL/FixJ family response regulator